MRISTGNSPLGEVPTGRKIPHPCPHNVDGGAFPPILVATWGIYPRGEPSPLQNSTFGEQKKIHVSNQYKLNNPDFILQETFTLRFILLFVLGYVLSF
jgi:hypothetical protein